VLVWRSCGILVRVAVTHPFTGMLAQKGHVMTAREMCNLGRKATPLAGVVVAVILVLPSLKLGLWADDYWFQVVIERIPFCERSLDPPTTVWNFIDGDPSKNRHRMDVGILPWWAKEDAQVSFMRPLAEWTHRLDYRFWPDQYMLMHGHNLLWLSLLVAVAGLLYGRIMGPGWGTCLATILYAADSGHVSLVSWIACRNETMSAAFGLLAILGHHRWRTLGPDVSRLGRMTSLLLPLVFLVLGVLSNEGGIGCCGYVFAYALILDPQRNPKRWLSLLPYGGVIIAWRLVYRLSGHGVLGSGVYTDPLLSPVLFIQNMPSRIYQMLMDLWTFDISHFGVSHRGGQILAGSLILGCMVAIVPATFRDRRIQFWLVGMGLSLIPACAGTAASRTLLMASVGAIGTIARLMEMAVSRAPSSASPARRWSFFYLRIWAIVFLAMKGVLEPCWARRHLDSMKATMQRHDAIIDTTPLSVDAVHQTVVLINPPSFYVGGMLGVARAARGLPFPARVRCLSWSSSGIALNRVNDRLLLIRYSEGLATPSLRDEKCPLMPGRVVKLSGTSFRVLEVNSENEPVFVQCRFDVPLEDPSLVWLAFYGEGYHVVSPPKLGETVAY